MLVCGIIAQLSTTYQHIRPIPCSVASLYQIAVVVVGGGSKEAVALLPPPASLLPPPTTTTTLQRRVTVSNSE